MDNSPGQNQYYGWTILVIIIIKWRNETDYLDSYDLGLKENIELKSGDRIYLIASHKDEGKMLPQGRFLFGNRRASPWEGAAPVEDNSADI